MARAEERRLRAQGRTGNEHWFGFSMFGLVGWSVVVPVLVGIALGAWIDRTTASRFSWTLILLLTGFILGCLNAWYWISRSRFRDEETPERRTRK